MIIKNKDEIIERLTEMLMNFEKELSSYTTDVYLYYDENTQKATLDTFVNVGGNSFLDDDHYLLYRNTGYCNPYQVTLFDEFCDISDLADAIGISTEQLKAETKNYLSIDDNWFVERYGDVREYVENNQEYMEALANAHIKSVNESKTLYEDIAHRIYGDFIDYGDFIEEVRRSEKKCDMRL